MTEVSVVMPVFNAASSLPDAVASILGSSFTDFELILIDDASTDNTWSVMQSYDDPRFVAARNDTNQGLCATLNRALGLARGDYIAVVGADDRYHQDFLLRTREVFERGGPELGAVATYVEPIDADGKPLVDHQAQTYFNHHCDFSDPAAWIWHNRFPGSAVVRRGVFDAVGVFAEDVPSAMDWDLWVRALAAGFTFHVIPEVLFGWRLHGETIITSDPETLLGYSLISQRHLHPYLMRIGRDDLLAANVAEFLTNAALITADVAVAALILDRVLTPLTTVQQAAAICAAGDELLRLQHCCIGEAAKAEHLRGLVAEAEQRAIDTADALREKDYELAAALDRLGAAEADRRAAQAEVTALKNSLIRRVGRKVKRRMGQ